MLSVPPVTGVLCHFWSLLFFIVAFGAHFRWSWPWPVGTWRVTAVRGSSGGFCHAKHGGNRQERREATPLPVIVAMAGWKLWRATRLWMAVWRFLSRQTPWQ